MKVDPSVIGEDSVLSLLYRFKIKNKSLRIKNVKIDTQVYSHSFIKALHFFN